MQIDFKPTLKQYEMFEAWDDATSTSILFGGGVGSAKSYGLMSLAVIKALQYKGVRFLIGRKTYRDLIDTTIQTLFKVFESFGMKSGIHYIYNQNAKTITFNNGSSFILRHIDYVPSDPNGAALGSLELTAAFLDEVGEMDGRVVRVVHSRTGRWKNEELGIKPMTFMSCNPSRNFLFNDFYKPWQKGELAAHRKFVHSTLKDNPYLGEAYRSNLINTLSLEEKRRLVDGLWEFDGDHNSLTKYDNVSDMFGYLKPTSWAGKWCITADIAFEHDKCLVILWNDFDVVKIVSVKPDEKPEDVVLSLQKEYKVLGRNIVYDATGAGLYLKNYLRGAYVFHSGAKAIKDVKNFEHLKTQCYYKLAERIMDGGVRVFDESLKEQTIDECLQIKTIPREKLDGVIKLIKKDEIKANIGRSPDILDTLAMREVLELKGGFSIGL